MFCQSKKWQIETDSLEVKMSSTVGKKDAKCLTQLQEPDRRPTVFEKSEKSLSFSSFLTILKK